MNADQGFELHPGAAQDINDIWAFVAEDSPAAARSFREEILATIRRLVPFPNQGHSRIDLTSRPLRFHPVRDFPIA
jgi:plasmid stabilization system protein ParE